MSSQVSIQVPNLSPAIPRNTQYSLRVDSNRSDSTADEAVAAADVSGNNLPLNPVVETEIDSNAATAKSDTTDISEIVRKMQDNIQLTRREIKFEYHDETGTPIVTVLDQETQQVIRQFPSEEVLALAERIAELSDESGGKLFRTVV